MLQTDEKGIYSIPAEQTRREDGKMRPKELEGNKTYTVLTAVLGEQFWELAQKLGSLSEEKKRELWKTGQLEVELSKGTKVCFDIPVGIVRVEKPGNSIVAVIS